MPSIPGVRPFPWLVFAVVAAAAVGCSSSSDAGPGSPGDAASVAPSDAIDSGEACRCDWVGQNAVNSSLGCYCAAARPGCAAETLDDVLARAGADGGDCATIVMRYTGCGLVSVEQMIGCCDWEQKVFDATTHAKVGEAHQSDHGTFCAYPPGSLADVVAGGGRFMGGMFPDAICKVDRCEQLCSGASALTCPSGVDAGGE